MQCSPPATLLLFFLRANTRLQAPSSCPDPFARLSRFRGILLPLPSSAPTRPERALATLARPRLVELARPLAQRFASPNPNLAPRHTYGPALAIQVDGPVPEPGKRRA